jgi:hypothetical protein
MSFSRLRILAARDALGIASATELIEAADSLLTRGVYSYSLGQLATVPNPDTACVADVAPWFFGALRELGIRPPSSRQEARAVIATWYIVNIAESTAEPESALEGYSQDLIASEWHVRDKTPGRSRRVRTTAVVSRVRL